MIRLEVKRQANESTGSLLRRFSKRVQSSGLVKRAKSLRFAERGQSAFKRKRAALVRLERRAKFARLKKLGKI